ncbi:MAG: hypothetical protein AAFX40_14715 [Cyanobacteria bacterium J06639_1]
MKLRNVLPSAAIGLIVLTMAWPARAQSCVPLRVVGGSGTEVNKSVSPPGTIFSKHNWNTDFVVPRGETFSRFEAEIDPGDSGEYSLKMFLKYNDNTADKVFDRKSVLLENGEPIVLTGNVRISEQPYQINLFVGGIQASGEPYTARVWGCR